MTGKGKGRIDGDEVLSEGGRDRYIGSIFDDDDDDEDEGDCNEDGISSVSPGYACS